jgi:hypothetical protein
MKKPDCRRSVCTKPELKQKNSPIYILLRNRSSAVTRMMRPTWLIVIHGSSPVVSTTFPPSICVLILCDCDCEVSEFGASTRAGPVCSGAGGSGEAGRGTLRAIDNCLVPGLICVSFTTFNDLDGPGVASDPCCACVGPGCDETDIVFINSACSCSAPSTCIATGLSLPAFVLGECSQLDIGVPDRDLPPGSWAEVIGGDRHGYQRRAYLYSASQMLVSALPEAC